MQKQRSLLVLILVLPIAAITVIVKETTLLGIDLKGDPQLRTKVKPSAENKQVPPQDLVAVQIIENRINSVGVSELLVQSVANNHLVQLPDINHPQQAKRVIGGTALLEFRQQKQGTESRLPVEIQVREAALKKQAELKKTGDAAAIAKIQASIKRINREIGTLFESTNPPLTGKYIKDAFKEPDPNGSNWDVDIHFDQTGGQVFAQLTKNLAGTGRCVGIFLDNTLISAPTVDVKFVATGITGGEAVITGNFTSQTANDLVVKLKYRNSL